MALVHIEGFDAYGPAGTNIASTLDASTAWYSVSSMTNVNVNRHGYGQSATLSSSLTALYVPTQSEYYMGLAYYSIVSSTPVGLMMMGWHDGVVTRYTHFQVAVNQLGAILLYGPAGTLVASSAAQEVEADTWHYVECYGQIHDTTGQVIVRVDGRIVLTYNGDTRATGADASINLIHLTNTNAVSYGAAAYGDDLYICDATGVDNNNFLGDVIVYPFYPTADEGLNNMTQVGGTGGLKYTAVDDLAHDSDTSYLHTDTVNHQEMYTVSGLPDELLDVLGVQVHVVARKESNDAKNYKIAAAIGASETLSGDQALAASYTTESMVLETQPGGSPWTPTAVESLEIGFKAT